MGSWKALFGGDYIKAEDFGGKTPSLTVTKVESGEVADPETGEVKRKGLFWFKELDRHGKVLRMVCNKTNAQLVTAMFGEDTDGWIGKRLSLRAEEVQVGPKRELGIRVYGSPDISAPVTATIVLPRKKPKQVTLQPTGKGKAPDPAPAREPGED